MKTQNEFKDYYMHFRSIGPERKLRTNLRMTCKIYSLLNWPAPFSGPRPKLNCPGGPNRPRPPLSSFLNSAPQRKAREGFRRRLSRRVRRRAVSLVPIPKASIADLSRPVPSHPISEHGHRDGAGGRAVRGRGR